MVRVAGFVPSKASQSTTILWNGARINIRRMIGLNEITELIDCVMDSVYNKEKNIFMPELIDFAIRTNIILRYTDIDLPVEVDKRYALLYGTDLYESVLHNISIAQVDSIVSAVNILFHNSIKY